jgi:hypothetical protein
LKKAFHLKTFLTKRREFHFFTLDYTVHFQIPPGRQLSVSKIFMTSEPDKHSTSLIYLENLRKFAEIVKKASITSTGTS